jgi:polyisoprenoid-binding protein YceI
MLNYEGKMQRPLSTLLAGAVILAATLPAAARPFKISNDVHTLNNVTFFSKATIVTIKGQTDQVLGLANVNPDNLAATSGSIKVDLHALDTGIAKRNAHMQGVLETDKYPYAEFKPTKINAPTNKAAANKPIKVTIDGLMTFHGVTKPVRAEATVTYLPEVDKEYRPGDWFQLEATFPLKLSDFNIVAPKLVPMKVSNDLSIALTVMAKGQ